MSSTKAIREPAKELRFTRSRQAIDFALGGVALASLAAGLVVLASPEFSVRGRGPVLDSYVPAVAAALLAVPAFWLAVHLARHAYLLLTPVGLEIFPLFFPARNFRLLVWSEIDHLEISADRRWMTVHLLGGGGVFLSLAPMRARQRDLLARAVSGIADRHGRRPAAADSGGRDERPDVAGDSAGIGPS